LVPHDGVGLVHVGGVDVLVSHDGDAVGLVLVLVLVSHDVIMLVGNRLLLFMFVNTFSFSIKLQVQFVSLSWYIPFSHIRSQFVVIQVKQLFGFHHSCAKSFIIVRFCHIPERLLPVLK